MSQLQAQGQMGGMRQGRAGVAMQGAGLSGGMAQSAQGQLTQMADPMMQQQANPFAPIMGGANAAFNIATNPDYGLLQPRVSAPPAPVTQPTFSYGGSRDYGLPNYLMGSNPQAFQSVYDVFGQ